MNFITSLKNRFFAYLWTGQSISRIGDNLNRIALSWWVLEKTGSATMMGTVMIFSTVPLLFFLLIGGVAVDRFSRVRLMLFSDFLRGILMAVVTILSFSGKLEIWHVCIASILFGFVDAFFQPAYTAIVPDIVKADFLPSANSLTSLSGQLAGIVGPALGAALIKMGGTSTVFLLDSLSFLVSAFCLLPLLKIQEAHTQTIPANKPLHDLREGLVLVFKSQWLWISIAIFSLANVTLAGPFSIGMPFLVKEYFARDVQSLGWIYSVASIGAVLGAVLMGRFHKIRKRGLIGYFAFLAAGLTFVIIGFLPMLGFVLLAVFLNGSLISVFSMIWVNILQEMVPNEKLGRVSSIDMLGSFALLPIGFGFVGWAIDRIDASTVFVICGGITVFLAIIGLSFKSIRAVD
jgi:DHA3 family tetracycline resistance protein-like MFS transporter